MGADQNRQRWKKTLKKKQKVLQEDIGQYEVVCYSGKFKSITTE